MTTYRVEAQGTGPPLIVYLCKLDGCGEPRDAGMPLCAPHWNLVPAAKRDAYRAQVAALKDATVDVLAAAKSAVRE